MRKRFCIALSGMLLCYSAAYGQTGLGQIQGTVKDATAAVIPKAGLALESIQTGNRFQTEASDVGAAVPVRMAPEARTVIPDTGGLFQNCVPAAIIARVGPSNSDAAGTRRISCSPMPSPAFPDKPPRSSPSATACRIRP